MKGEGKGRKGMSEVKEGEGKGRRVSMRCDYRIY